MHVVHPGQPPQRLVGVEADAQAGVARQGAEAVAMPVQRQPAVPAQRLHGGEAAPVQADHHAASAFALHQIGVAAHGVRLVADVEGDHDVLAGAVLVAAHPVHHRRHALGQRGVDRVGADLVVLDEVEPGGAERADQLAGLLRRQAEVRLDDGADQRPALHPGQPPGAGHAVPRRVEALAVRGGQADGVEPQAGDLAQVEQVAGHRRGQRRQVGADVAGGEGDGDAGAPPRSGPLLPLQPCVGQAGGGGGFKLLHPLHHGAGAGAQVVRLAVDAGEGAAGLLPRHDLRHLGGVQRGFDQIGRLEAVGAHGVAHRRLRSGKGRTGSRPSQSREALRIRSNILPFGPATSDSSITVPGWYSVSK